MPGSFPKQNKNYPEARMALELWVCHFFSQKSHLEISHPAGMKIIKYFCDGQKSFGSAECILVREKLVSICAQTIYSYNVYSRIGILVNLKHTHLQGEPRSAQRDTRLSALTLLYLNKFI